MKLTKSQRAYVAVLVVAVAAFLADRFLVGAGDSRVEQASAAPPGAGAIETPLTTPRPPSTSDTPSIAAQLATLQEMRPADLEGVREAFSPSESWNQQLRPAHPPQDRPAASTAGNQSVRADQFVAGHRLMSILHLAEGGVALVDDKVVRIGQTLDGFTLIELTEDTAVFASDERRVELRLADPAGP
ncbi:MAG: hypothetical protein ACYTFO_04355 [Planctomycetota bacterium]|jgi:hypothetical protein